MKREFEKETIEHSRVKKLHSQAVQKMKEDASKIEILRKENEALKKTLKENEAKTKS